MKEKCTINNTNKQQRAEKIKNNTSLEENYKIKTNKTQITSKTETNKTGATTKQQTTRKNNKAPEQTTSSPIIRKQNKKTTTTPVTKN